MLKIRWDFLGLSTDSKPSVDTGKVVNGSTFYEVDTSTVYIYYNGEWYEQDNNIIYLLDL